MHHLPPVRVPQSSFSWSLAICLPIFIVACCLPSNSVDGLELASTFSSKPADQVTVICVDIMLMDGSEREACTVRGELIRIPWASETLGLSPSVLDEDDVAVRLYRLTEHPLRDGSGMGESITWLETIETEAGSGRFAYGPKVEVASMRVFPVPLPVDGCDECVDEAPAEAEQPGQGTMDSIAQIDPADDGYRVGIDSQPASDGSVTFRITVQRGAEVIAAPMVVVAPGYPGKARSTNPQSDATVEAEVEVTDTEVSYVVRGRIGLQ